MFFFMQGLEYFCIKKIGITLINHSSSIFVSQEITPPPRVLVDGATKFIFDCGFAPASRIVSWGGIICRPGGTVQ